MSTFGRRRPGVILYVLCLGGLFFTGFLGGFGQRWLQRGIVYGPPPDIPLAGVYPFGVNVALEQYSPSQRRQVLSCLEEDGFRWVRQALPWDQVEPHAGEYTWTPWDQIVNEVARHGLSLILVIDRSPAWSRTSPSDDPQALPANPADLASFVQTVVRRYGDGLAALEIWREPNLQAYSHEGGEWAGGPDPAQYVAHLRAAYQAAKAVNAAIVVLNAGLAPTTENSRRAMSDVDFLEAMYDAGAAPYFDALAARPLGFWSGPDDRRVDVGALNFSRVLLLREIVVRHGDANKGIWAVEFGWNALPADWTGLPPPWGTDDPAKQARRTVEAVRRAQAEWPWMGPMLALHLDPAAPPDDPIQGFALLDDNLAPRPAYIALRDLIAQHAVGVGRYPPNAWFADVEWQPVQGATVGRTAGGDFVVSRAAPFARFYLAIALLLAAAGIVAWRLDRLVRLPRWELAFALTITIFLLSPWVPLTLATLFALLALFIFRPDLGLATVVLFIPFFQFSKYFGPRPFSILELFTWLTLAAWVIRRLPDLVYGMRETGDGMRETGDGMRETGDGMRETGDGMRETGDGMRETGDGMRETGDGMRETGDGMRDAGRVSRIPYPVSCFTPLDYAVLALLIASLLSLVVAANKGVAFHELRVVVIDSILFYFLIRSSGLSHEQQRRESIEGLWRLVDVLVLAGLLVSLYGFYQYIFSGDVIVAEGVRRMRGVYPSPNNLSLFLGRIVPLAGVVAIWGPAQWRRVFYAVAGLVTAGALFLTFSRAAWLVSLPATMLFVGLVRGRRALTAAVAAAVALLLSVLPFAGTARIRSLFELSPGSSTYRRLKLWQSAVHMIRDHPIFGVGLDNFLYQYREYYILAGARDDPSLSHPHNLILDFWTRLGILGVVALGWLIVAFFQTTWQLYGRLDENGRILVLGLMSSMVYALAHGLLDNSYFLVDLAYVFMLEIGIASRLRTVTGSS